MTEHLKQYRVIICGDRDWNATASITQLLRRMPPGTQIVHGNCKGADILAGRIAQELGFNVIPMPADWKQYGRAAGPIRNTQMLDMGVDAVYAFHGDISKSKGTKDMLKQAQKRGVATFLIKQ